MKSFLLALFLPALMIFSGVSEELPVDAKTLLNQRNAQLKKLDQELNRKLTEVKDRCLRDGDLEGANAVAAIIKGAKITESPLKTDPLIGTVWNFLGSERQWINQFTFLQTGEVKCENSYTNAKWERLDAKTILFYYGTEGNYAILRMSDDSEKFMSGSNLSSKSRSLQLVE